MSAKQHGKTRWKLNKYIEILKKTQPDAFSAWASYFHSEWKLGGKGNAHQCQQIELLK